ncbi:hypothetical protein H181DRAFT_00630 [Streptomyces sp. WMMB 714]|uniref:hypothetical protein n=1 Tax=Streptomyces sp. WMMB 714 TaxID=1286822 RepID=UPI0005F830EC|nr:hypothetical protein [Streptomyces sp. WMMB 714]SCK11474.1 hypothetical protein H181DRAFT_00630 [Streptomyces sp. WMMB 714]
MSEWGVGVIAACSALAGSMITGWFTRSAGHRQATAARHAGDRQADALLETVRMTLQEQRVVRILDLRRQTYVQFLEAAEVVILSRRTGHGTTTDRPALQRALGAVLLEGPDETGQAARELVEALSAHGSLDDIQAARSSFIAAAQHALASPEAT